jgi:hypothetical protein
VVVVVVVVVVVTAVVVVVVMVVTAVLLVPWRGTILVSDLCCQGKNSPAVKMAPPEPQALAAISSTACPASLARLCKCRRDVARSAA